MTVNLFNANFYREANSDLAQLTDDEAFQHLLAFGLEEEREFSPLVDIDLYRQNNPDLVAAGLTTNRELFEHLQTIGVAEGREFSENFDASFYRSANPDLVSLDNEQLFIHFRDFGRTEGRQGAPESAAATEPAIAAGLTATTIAPPLPPFGGSPAEPPGPLPVPPDLDSLSFPPTTEDTGDVLNTSIDVGVSNFNITLNESVGSSDPNDFYRFVAISNSSFNLSVSGSSLGVEMYLDSNNDNTIDPEEAFFAGASGLRGTATFGGPSISFNGSLVDGTYYVRVFSSGEDSNYQLNVSTFGNPIPVPVEPPVIF